MSDASPTPAKRRGAKPAAARVAKKSKTIIITDDEDEGVPVKDLQQLGYMHYNLARSKVTAAEKSESAQIKRLEAAIEEGKLVEAKRQLVADELAANLELECMRQKSIAQKAAADIAVEKERKDVAEAQFHVHSMENENLKLKMQLGRPAARPMPMMPMQYEAEQGGGGGGEGWNMSTSYSSRNMRGMGSNMQT